MKRKVCISLLLALFFLLCSCSLSHKIPYDGTWHNKELGITFEFTTRDDFTRITNVVWDLKNNESVVLGAHLGYGAEIIFYYTDENDNEVDVLVGGYEYSEGRFIVTAWQMAAPFDVSGTLTDVSDKVFIFEEK